MLSDRQTTHDGKVSARKPHFQVARRAFGAFCRVMRAPRGMKAHVGKINLAELP